jgi:hypothetical protein
MRRSHLLLMSLMPDILPVLQLAAHSTALLQGWGWRHLALGHIHWCADNIYTFIKFKNNRVPGAELNMALQVASCAHALKNVNSMSRLKLPGLTPVSRLKLHALTPVLMPTSSKSFTNDALVWLMQASAALVLATSLASWLCPSSMAPSPTPPGESACTAVCSTGHPPAGHDAKITPPSFWLHASLPPTKTTQEKNPLATPTIYVSWESDDAVHWTCCNSRSAFQVTRHRQ